MTSILVCDLMLVSETAFHTVFLVLDPGSRVAHDVARLSSLFSLILSLYQRCLALDVSVPVTGTQEEPSKE